MPSTPTAEQPSLHTAFAAFVADLKPTLRAKAAREAERTRAWFAANAGPAPDLRALYIKTLDAHDWTYIWADDCGAWSNGNAENDLLRQLQPSVDADWSLWNERAPEQYRVRRAA